MEANQGSSVHRLSRFRQITSIAKVKAGEYDVAVADGTLFRVAQDRGLGDRVEGWSAWAYAGSRLVATTMSAQSMREVLDQIDSRHVQA